MVENYNGKFAYNEDIVINYENDRKQENLWLIENRLLKKLLKKLAPSSILDLPVGTGRFFKIYKSYSFIKSVVGVDISEDMLLYSQKRILDMHLESKITVQKGDAESLNISPFECIICFRLAHLLPDNILNKVIANLVKITTKYIILQIYDVILNQNKIYIDKKKFLLNFLYKFKRNIKNLLSRNINKTWLNIENFPHHEEYLNSIFADNHLEIKNIINCDANQEKNTETRIYVLEKK